MLLLDFSYKHTSSIYDSRLYYWHEQHIFKHLQDLIFALWLDFDICSTSVGWASKSHLQLLLQGLGQRLVLEFFKDSFLKSMIKMLFIFACISLNSFLSYNFLHGTLSDGQNIDEVDIFYTLFCYYLPFALICSTFMCYFLGFISYCLPLCCTLFFRKKNLLSRILLCLLCSHCINFLKIIKISIKSIYLCSLFM